MAPWALLLLAGALGAVRPTAGARLRSESAADAAGGALSLRSNRSLGGWGPCDCCESDWCGCDGCVDCASHLGAAGGPRGADLRAGRLPGLASGLVGDECLRIGASAIPGAGQGLFAACALRQGQALKRAYVGSLRSEKQLLEEVGKVDHSYVWCPEPTAPGDDVVCVDAQHVAGASNPLRYVNGARGLAQCGDIGVEMCQFDRNLYFRVVRHVSPSQELLVDYGPAYWGEPQCAPV
mmetsp:Transcript_33726/g.100140  ORF Transcript_33726/g.100140 Transcript_33726/m.100140 type:complete len:237 (-) Transcript_33726:28-738(-)